MSPPKSITIGPYSFAVTPGYSAGAFAVTPTELEALDALRAERLRKKGFKVLEKLRARSGRRTLSEGELRHLTDQIAAFDRELRLERAPSPAQAVPARPLLGSFGAAPDGDFDAELAKLAQARLDAEERARGLTLTPEQRDAALSALREEPLLREQARLRVEVVFAERGKLLQDLF